MSQADESLPDVRSRAVVLGSGIAALVSAGTMKAVGLAVTLIRLPDAGERIYWSMPGFDGDAFVRDVSAGVSGIDVLDIPEAPAVHREPDRFRLVFGDGREEFFGALLLAPGVGVLPPPAGIADLVETIAPEMKFSPGLKVGFLLDAGSSTDQALGMTAIRLARENIAQGGKSYVFMRHVPVAHVFGEELYDQAKREGVRFVRYGEEIPRPIVSPAPVDDTRTLGVAIHDIMGNGEELQIQCDRVICATGPDPSSIPGWARDIAGDNRDTNGFLSTDNIHCVSGNSFEAGLFIVGNATGRMDLIRIVAQAQAAAGNARAFLLGAKVSDGRETVAPVSVGDECCRCLTCFRLCPHAAVLYAGAAARSNVLVRPLWCRDCGICTAECPRTVLHETAPPTEESASLLQMFSRGDTSPSVVVYACRRSLKRAAGSYQPPSDVVLLPVNCAGGISESMIWDALVLGAQGVLLIGCHGGNCASHHGTELASARAEAVSHELKSMGHNCTRVSYVSVAPNEPARPARVIEEFKASLPAGSPAE